MAVMARFHVFIKENYPVYEPAEGGYYVCARRYDRDTHEVFTNAKDAADYFADMVEILTEEGHDLSDRSFSGEVFLNKKGELILPWAEFDYDGYIGHGFDLVIDVEEPKDKPYEGYC